MELERRTPTRLMNSRGNQLLQEEKERNKVNKALPRIEQVSITASFRSSFSFYSRGFRICTT